MKTAIQRSKIIISRKSIDNNKNNNSNNNKNIDILSLTTLNPCKPNPKLKSKTMQYCIILN